MEKPKITYTQVLDEETGEIKYIPNQPPTPPPSGPTPGGNGEEDETGKPEDERDDGPFKIARDAANLDIDEKLVDVIKMLEDNNKRLRYATRLQTGKLDGRRLTAYKTSDRLFKKKAIKHKDYQFTIMLDTSGSMFSGDGKTEYKTRVEEFAHCKLKVSIESIVKVIYALEEIKIPVSVIAMNNETRLLKEFNTKLDITDFMRRLRFNVIGYSADGEPNMGGTSEMVAYQETIAYIDRNTHAKQENIVLVLSDGAPGGYHNTPVYMEDQTLRVVDSHDSRRDNSTDSLRNYWEHQNKVNVYGIGIMSAAKQIPRSKRLDSVEKLPEVLGGLIQEIIL